MNKKKNLPERGSKNPWVVKEISQLLDIPTSKWKKNDWVNAAKCLASNATERGIINRAISDGIKKDLSEHINTVTKRRRGRPEKRPTIIPKNMLEIVERLRLKLAQKKKVDPSKITDKAVAFSLAEYSKNKDKTIRISKHQLGEKYQNWIKSLKRKAKLGF